MNEKKLKEILYKHDLWLKGKGGKPAKLEEVSLENVNFRYANFMSAELINVNLFNSDCLWANFSKADLSGSKFSETDFYGASFHGANLRQVRFTDVILANANFRYADLSGAIFEHANIRGADFRNATLNNTKFEYINNKIFFEILPGLYLLKMQLPETKLKAWKYLFSDWTSPFYEYKYEVGKTYTEKDYSIDERSNCAKGFNIATLQWCLKNSGRKTDRFIEVEFSAKDIIAVPFVTDGKFRVKKLKVLRGLTRKQAEKEMLRYLNDNKL